MPLSNNTFPATSFSSQLALACIETTPFKSDVAVSFVDELKKYLEWHSTTEILRSNALFSLNLAHQ